MEASRNPRMTAEEFVAWAMAQPEGRRYELEDGLIAEMASERARHARIKLRICRRLDEAVERSDLSCTVYPDGMAVRVDDATVYEPDAAVRCGEPLDDDATSYDDPILVVEVGSPSTSAVDKSTKLIDYFRIPSLRHYLIVHGRRPTVIHHERMADGSIQTRIATTGTLRLDPPGIELDIASLFP